MCSPVNAVNGAEIGLNDAVNSMGICDVDQCVEQYITPAGRTVKRPEGYCTDLNAELTHQR